MKFSFLIVLFFVGLLFNGCGNDISRRDSLIIYSMQGEPFTFRDEDCKVFMNDNKKINIKSVYSYTNLGNKFFYLEDVDYIIDRDRNMICRTDVSSMPNFSIYLPIYDNDGKFEFSAEPRNPPRTIPFQVFIDYNFKDKPIMISSKRFLPNEFFKKNLKVVLIGDSIFASADTISQHFNSDRVKDHFMTHLAKNFTHLYGTTIETINLSRGGIFGISKFEYFKYY